MEIGIEQARARLGDLVNHVTYGRETVYLTRYGRRVAAIVPAEEPTMTTTTSYGTWNNRVQPSDLTVEASVGVALGDYTDDYDLDALVSDYREAINAALPDGVTLAGDEFIGPYASRDWAAEDYPVDADGRLDLKAIVDDVDFWAIAAKHDRTA